MRGKLFKHMFLVAMSVFVACTALFMWSLYSYFSEARQNEQREETAYVAAAVEEGGEAVLQTKLPKDSANRITWIDRDGTVLFDSVAKAEDMENHADRDEVQQAMKTGEGESTRYSSTLSRKTTNYALRLDDGTILRLSGTQYTVVSLLVSQFQVLVAVLVLAVGLAAFLAYRVSESIIEPINHISLENPDERDVYPELRPLVRRISGQNKQIQYQMEALRQAHKQQDEMRREFTANVSHELKTPLTSISGYAEIIREGMVRSEDVSRFAGKIYEEAQRLMTLVEDILNLSHLDEGAPGQERCQGIDLYALCQRALASLDEAARQRAITLTLTGGHYTVDGAEKLLSEIIFNLCDNAIKYNQDSGAVKVSVTKEEGFVVLTVQDTGIGIPAGETDRVFERFYRVDKSHSKKIGGTGLGLSIVKHAAAYHDARIQLDSQLGHGTRVRVLFHPSQEGEGV